MGSQPGSVWFQHPYPLFYTPSLCLGGVASMAYLSAYCHLALLSLFAFSSANAPPPQCLNILLRGDGALYHFTSPRVSAQEIVWLISHNLLNFQLPFHHPFPLGEGQPAQSTFMAFLSSFLPLTRTRIPFQSLLKK